MPPEPTAKRPDVLIGGRGFLARALQREIARVGRPLRIVTREPKGLDTRSLPAETEVVRGDINASKSLPALLSGARAVYVAVPVAALAESPGDWNPLPFLAACGEAGAHLILPIDISLYKTEATAPFDENVDFAGKTPIGEAQLEWENAAHVEGLRRRFPVTILRFPGLLGEGLSDGELSGVIEAARAGRPVEIVGRGEEVVERLHVDDAARACVLAATRPRTAGEILHVPGYPIRRRNLFRILIKVAGSKSEVVSIDIPEGPRRKRRGVPEAPREFWVRGEKTRRLLGFTPEIPYERGLRESLATHPTRRIASG
jgi:nucleoside-diphosphate-sugar epimerase